jgi:hypothetical protein
MGIWEERRGRVSDAMADILGNAFVEIGKLPTDFTMTDLADGIEFATEGVLCVDFSPKELECSKVKVSDWYGKLDKVQEPISQKDRIIAAIEDWVTTHPEEAAQPLKATLSETQKPKIWWSAKDILEEIKNDTERGRREYNKLIQLTIDLLTRGRIRHSDGIIAILEDWVAEYPEEAAQPIRGICCKADADGARSARDILEEIKNNTEFGRRAYCKLRQSIIDLFTQGCV